MTRTSATGAVLTAEPARPHSFSTPSRAAGLAVVDPKDPRISSRTAALLIGAFYLLGFAAGIASGIYGIGRSSAQVLDYGSARLLIDAAQWLGEIVGAFAILYLITAWLEIPGPLAGIPNRGAPVVPTALTALMSAMGLAIAELVIDSLPGGGGDTNGHVVVNPWLALSGLRFLNAGVVEEIVIVAIPVLLGRRAGWHPLVIIGISVLLRWPYHVYHGVFATIPWVIVWAGTNVTVYLLLRRLWPLIVVHTAWDLWSGAIVPAGTTAQAIFLTVIGAAILWMLGRMAWQRRSLVTTASVLRQGPDAAKLVLARRWDLVAVPAVLLLAAAAAAAYALLETHGGAAVVGVIAGFGFVVALVVAFLLLVKYVNVLVQRGPGGALGVVRYRTLYTGDVLIEDFLGTTDTLAAVRTIAGAAPADTTTPDRMLLCTGYPHRAAGQTLAAAGYPIRSPLKIVPGRVKIPLELAATLGEGKVSEEP